MDYKKFFCIDAHTCGNPVRVVAGGAPSLDGQTIAEKRLHFLSEYDWIRRALMFEPRGHDMMSGSILFPPSDPTNDMAILFIETSGCLPMCGHGTIGTVTIALEEGLVIPKIPGKLRLETPAGLVLVSYKQSGRKVESVTLTNVPSFLMVSNLEVNFPPLGILRFDVAYGGNFYAIIDQQENFQGIQSFSASELVTLSLPLRMQINETFPKAFIHPEKPVIQGVSHLMWTGTPLHRESTARNAVFYGDKAIDRSPCGTGTSARLAQWHAKGLLAQGEPFIHESYIGSTFTGTVRGTTTVGTYPAIIPEIEGWARVMGYNHIIVDPDDPFAEGFQVL